MTRVQSASISWKNDTPYSNEYGDIYFNSEGGQAETEHVFLRGNQLHQRFSTLNENQNFVIAECGLGSGLNFFSTCNLWMQEASKQAHLHYIAFEKHPLTQSDFSQCLRKHAVCSALHNTFLAQYPPLQEGFHTLFFQEVNIKLTLIIGDININLLEVETQVDAWFLDGFTPSKNPHMWSPALFKKMHQLSHSETTLATYTAARVVKDALTTAGFKYELSPGYGPKRHMLRGYASNCPMATKRLTPSTHPVLIIGSGLAGATTAYQLACHGQPVIVLEACNQPATQASGNLQGALFAKLASKPSVESDLHCHGLIYASHWIHNLLKDNPLLGELCGLIQLASTTKDALKQAKLLAADLYAPELLQHVDADKASHFAGTRLNASGLFFPKAGWVAPRLLCQHLLQHPLISVQYESKVNSLTFDSNLSVWHLKTDQQEYTSPLVVLCNAHLAKTFEVTKELPIKPIRGQTTTLPARTNDPDLHCVVCAEGYISPAINQTYCFGATYDLHDLSPIVRTQDHQLNIDQLRRSVPAFPSIDAQNCSGHVGFRCSSPDYLPLVGEVADYARTCQAFATLRYDANFGKNLHIPRLNGLYINVGHGSKGLITCPMSADVITAQILNLTRPLPKSLIQRLDPARFILRDLARRII